MSAPAEGSFLAELAQRRRQMAEEKPDFDLDIPAWDNFGVTIKVHFRPISEPELVEVTKQATKQARKGSALKANMQLIVKACTGLSVDLGNGNAKEYTGFGDATLGADFNVEEKSAQANVRELYKLDGYITSTADGVIEKSGFANRQIRDQLAGE